MKPSDYTHLTGTIHLPYKTREEAEEAARDLKSYEIKETQVCWYLIWHTKDQV